jgi:glucose-6-phosphate-specific signal transduction histidine kinase
VDFLSVCVSLGQRRCADGFFVGRGNEAFFFRSFAASALTLLCSRFYALAYAANDAVLIVLWVLASLQDAGYYPMVICFFVFLINDSYGFINWSRMQRRQKDKKCEK